jgi:dienelactone hydrolase
MPTLISLVRYRAIAALVFAAGFAALVASWAGPVDRVGVVLMHGEQGAPGRVVDRLAADLEKAGYLVGRPDMYWSARRSYEAPFAERLAAIDDAIAKLKNLGATSIVVGGFSLGGNAAIAFGASHPGLLGIIGLAPGSPARARPFPSMSRDGAFASKSSPRRRAGSR